MSHAMRSPVFSSVAVLLTLASAVSAQEEASPAIEPVAPDLGRPVDFNIDVMPVFQAKCLACHNKTTAEADLVLETYEGVVDYVTEGSPDDSYLYSVAARAEEPHMPPLPNKVAAKPLTPEELGILRQWIQDGAKPGMAAPMDDAVKWQPVPDAITAIYSLALSADARFIAAGRANRLVVYDLPAQTQVAELTDPALLAVQQDGEAIYGSGVAHRDFIHALAISPDGNLIASAGYRVVKLWERQRNVQLQNFAGDAPVTALAVSADGTLAATAHAAGPIRLWSLATGQPAGVLEGHTAAITAVAFTPDAALVVAGADDNTVRTWNAADAQPVATAATPAPIRSLITTTDGTQIITGHGDNVIRVYPLPQPETELQPALEITGHGGPVVALAMMPTTNELLSGSDDATIRIWNLENGQQAFAQNLGGPITSIAVSADGAKVAAGGANNLARVWDRAGNQQLAEVKGDPVLDRTVISLTDEQTVAKNKQALADAAQKAGETDVTSREESLKKANEQKEAADKALAEAETKVTAAEEAAKAAAEALAASPEDEALKKKKEEADTALKNETDARDKAKAAVASAERAINLSTEALAASKQRLEEAKAALEAATQYATDMDAKVAAATEQAGQAPKPIRAVAFSADGKQLATAGDDGKINLWDSATGKHLETLTGHTAAVTALAFLEGGSLVSAAADNSTVLWETRPQWKLAGRLGASEENPLDVSASPFVDRVLCLDFSPDGALLATGGGDPSRSGELMLWDVANRSLVRTFEDAHSDTVFDVEFSWDGKLLASGAADKFVKTFNVETGEFVRSYEGHTNHVLGVSWKADGSVIASAGADNAIKLWNTETGEQQRTITGYNKQVTDVDYVGVQDIIVTAGGDSQVRTFNANNGSPRRPFAGSTDFVYAVTASRDEAIVVAAGEDGVIRVWNGTNGQAITTFEPPAPESEAETAAVN
ncbi:MAG: hypothetical protein DWQ34_02810 [Planctomycetota bacterium]|nr:MAG: hypothetical protein DWQ34_02810 [Planctomycetota bacterium]REK20589.1 MAG: hypothetical protein DWQ41_24600 [Planctomycetota bacterium]REK35086.1 MAG: hypothetical protein DWQ45_12040 [Planctomycetota bacterium]